jgi:polyisoprenoid-binding protein YceI
MKTIKNLILLAALSLIGIQANAQVITKYQTNDASTISVTGTSTLHNWKEDLKKFNIGFLMDKSNNETITINKVQFNALVGDLKSESSLMDDKTFSALKKDKFPTVSFVSDQEVKMALQGNNFSGKVSGKLTIKGTTKQVLITISGTLENDGVKVSGMYPISMSDYGVKPPTALFGTIKSGNNIQLHFDLKFNKVSQP